MVQLAQNVVAVLLFFVLFFGIAFILNMLLRQTWIMSFLYPIVVILIIDEFKFSNYFTNPGWALSTLVEKAGNLTVVDIIILSSGFAGTIVSGIVIRALRKNGYQMF